MREQTRPLATSQGLLLLANILKDPVDVLTFKGIAAIKIDSSITIDRKVWCTFRRRECILGWDFEVDHNYVMARTSY